MWRLCFCQRCGENSDAGRTKVCNQGAKLLPGRGSRRVLLGDQAGGVQAPTSTPTRAGAPSPAATASTVCGAISTVARKILQARWSFYNDEYAFYESTKRLFWCKLAALGKLPRKL